MVCMQLLDEERDILAHVARRLDVDVARLTMAVEDESAVELGRVLRVDELTARARLDPIVRLVAMGDDWGAGCRLLTDDMRRELRAALWALA